MNNSDNIGNKIQNELNEVADWKALHRLSMSLLKPGTITENLMRVLHTVTEFHSTQYGAVSFFNPVTGTLAIKASIGLNDDAVASLAGIKPGQGCCGFAFSERHRVVIEDFQSTEQFIEFRPWAEQQSIRSVYSTPFYDAGGDTLGVLSVYFDKPHTPTVREKELADICATTIALILDRERTEMALRHERDRRDQVLRGMAEGFCVLDYNFNVLEMNTAALRINQRPFYELAGQSHWKLWPESENSELGRQYRKTMTERVTVHFENQWEDTNGKIGWYEICAHPIEEGLAVFFRDITQRKTAEDALRDSETRYRLLSESISTLVWRTDPQGIVIQGKESWSRYTGHEAGSDQDWYDAVHLALLCHVTQADADVLWRRN